MGALARIINGALASTDIAFTRRTTLDRTRAQLADSASRVQALDEALVAAKSQSSSLEAALADMRVSALALEEKEQSATRLQAELMHNRRLLIQHQTACKWGTVDAMERLLVNVSAERTCPLCGYRSQEASFQPIVSHCSFGGGVLKRHQCPECDVIFGADKMFALNAKELSQEYEWHYMVYEEGDSTAAEVRAFHSLSPRKDGRYVNFGAGAWSNSVKVLREQGWDVYAYEPHSSAASHADWLITNEADLASKPFDGLFTNNVLEHFRYPVEALVDMKRYLKPGALMAHATPCYEYLYEYTRFHLFFFLGRSRELLAQLAGLSIESYEVEGHFMNCVFSNNNN